MNMQNPPSTFVLKLREVVETNNLSCAAWSATGESFELADTATFSAYALPLFEGTNTFSSFLRQLHFHGFRKVGGGGNEHKNWEFSHPSFVKGKPELMSKIRHRNMINRAPIGGNAQGRVRVLEDRLANIAARMALVLDGEGGGRSAIKRKSADTF